MVYFKTLSLLLSFVNLKLLESAGPIQNSQLMISRSQKALHLQAYAYRRKIIMHEAKINSARRSSVEAILLASIGIGQ